MLKHQVAQDKQFVDSLLTVMQTKVQEDRNVMASAFRENLQVLQESFAVFCEMSQTMMAYYQEKTREKFGSPGRGSS